MLNFSKLMTLIALLAVFAFPDASHAAVLHDNSGATDTNTPTYFNGSSTSRSVADTFQLDQASTIQSFGIGYTSITPLTEINVAIYDTSFNLLYGVTQLSITSVDTGLNSAKISDYNIFSATTEAVSIDLNAGTYWFAFQMIDDLGPDAARISGGASTADTLDGTFLQNNGQFEIDDFQNWSTVRAQTAPALDFTIYGVPSAPAVPLPAGLPLLLGALGAFGALRLRARQ